MRTIWTISKKCLAADMLIDRSILAFPDSNRCIHQVSEADRKCKEVQLFDDEVMEEFLDESGSQSDVVAGGFLQSASTADLKT